MMKNLIIILLLSPLLILWGCPVGVDYPPAKPGTEKIDKRLLGIWKCNKDEPELIKIKVEKRDDFSYKVSILEKSAMYSLEGTEFTAWVTKIDKMNFIYAEESGVKGKYYTYAYEVDGPVFTLTEVAFLDKGTDGIKSTETFRTELSNSMKNEEFIVKKLYYTPTSN